MENVVDFILADNPKGLFPLDSVPLLVKHGERAIRDFVYKEIFDDANKASSFTTFPVAYALKDQRHLRRCLILDPVGAFYIYDLVWRNRKRFHTPQESPRRHYGYAFQNGQPVASFADYHNFRRQKYEFRDRYKCFAQVDIANCFNNFYHHDVVSFLANHISQPESEQAGHFLREGNSGRSVGCFPQGIYPAKTIGNFFLSFVEASREISSEVVIRFLDDILICSNGGRQLEHDLIILQQLIGERGMSLNSAKTRIGGSKDDSDERQLDELKIRLLEKREEVADYDEDEHDAVELDEEEVEYLKSLLDNPAVAEEDVELALSLLKEEPEEAERLAELVTNNYPNLLRHLYNLAADIEDNGAIWTAIKARAESDDAHEFELFWIVRMVADHYPFDPRSAEMLHQIFAHPRATPVVKAAILEVPDNEFGFLELKEQQLRAAASGLLAISAAVGLRTSEKAKRNQGYKYAAKASRQMKLVCDICSGM